jgi:peptidoglycan/LPS O-acetylase OafA/YrhL
LLRRILRIIPVWWLALFSLFLGQIIGLKVLIINMFFLFGFLSYQPWMVPITASWSLFVEETFYILFPFFFSQLKIQGLWCGFILTSLISRIWINQGADWGIPLGNSFLYKSPLNHFQFFFLGMILFNYYQKGYLSNYSSRSWFDGLLILIVVCMFLEPSIPRELICLIVVGCALNPHSLIFKSLDFPFFKWSGVRCYFIYIAHGPIRVLMAPVITPLLRLMGEAPSPEKAIIHFLLLSTLTLLLAQISFKYLEKPLMERHGRKFTSQVK